MRGEEIPHKRHTDTCRGIATYIAHPLLVPTHEAYWYLPWDCYLSHAHSLCPLKRHTDTCPGISRSHSRGILILAVGLLPITCPLIVPTQEAYWYLPWYCYWSFLQAHSRPTQVAPLSVAWTFSQTFTLVVIVTCPGLKPTCAHSRDNTVKLSWASHHYCLF